MYQKLKKCLNSRSNRQTCSIEKPLLKNFAIFTGKHLYWGLLLIDLRASTIFINFKVMYQKLKKCLSSRSNHQSCSIGKAVLKNFAIFTGKYPYWTLLLIDLRASRPTTFLKRDSNVGVFLWILQKFYQQLFWW